MFGRTRQKDGPGINLSSQDPKVWKETPTAHTRAVQLRQYLIVPLLLTCLCGEACTAESNTAIEPGNARQEPFSKAETALISRYPSVAPRILSHAGEDQAYPSPFFKLSAELPTFAEDGVKLYLNTSTSIIIHEEGVSGESETVEQSVAYPREGGFVYWTQTPQGMEEWLLLEPGRAYAHEAASTWILEGAKVRAHGELLEIIPENQDHGGFWVQAPVAYTESGRVLKPTLRSPSPERIELYIDAQGEGVLIDPSWTPTGAMITPRDLCETAILPDGRILVTGGNIEHNPPTLLAEIYEPQSEAWKPAGTMIYPGIAHTATTLPSGWVLIAGGYYIQYTANGADYAFPPKAQLFQPSTNTWSTGAGMLSTRFAHRATLLPNGKVLITGGISGINNSYLNSAELYDPALNAFKPAAPMNQAKAGHAALLLTNGKVLVTGGETPGGQPYAGAEIYDPLSNTWKAAAPMNKVRKDHRMVLLPNGKILAAGQLPINGQALPAVEPGDAELYDPVLNQWTPTSLMASQALLPSLTLMGNQKVLLTALDPVQKKNTAQVYDPITDHWSEAKPLTWERKSRQAERLPDGKVLILCGTPTGSPNPVPVAEIYDPGIFYGETCNSPSQCESGFCVDGVCCDSACDAGPCDACSLQAGAKADGVCTLLSNTLCDDSNPCTKNDRCDTGICSGAPLICDAPTNCHEAGTCDPATGMCSSSIKEDGASCGTGQACYAGECMDSSAIPPHPQVAPDGEPGSGGCNCMLANTPSSSHPLLGCLLSLWLAGMRLRRPKKAAWHNS